jgi:hypothetical protein
MYSGKTRLEQLIAYLNECGEPKTAKEVARYFKTNTRLFDYKLEEQLAREFNSWAGKNEQIFIFTGRPRKISLREYKNTQKVIEISEKDVIQFSFFNSLKALIGKYKNSILKYKGESIKISM